MAEHIEEKQGKHYVVDSRFILPLDIAGGNAREDYGHDDGSFQELVTSIGKHGVIKEIKAYRDPEKPGYWRSITGHTRIQACEARGFKDDKGEIITVKVIPCDIRKMTPKQIIVELAVENRGRQLNVLELSNVVNRLLKLEVEPKMTVQDVADELSLTPHAVRNLRMIADAPKRLRELIKGSVIGYTTALDFIKSSVDYNEAMEKIEKVLGNNTAVAEQKSRAGGEKKVKVTRADLNKVNNKVDSFMELRKVFIEQVTKQEKVKNNDLYFFAKMIIENKYTAKDFRARFFE